MFGFDIRGVTPGGAAAVRMVLPEGSAPTGYFKQDATGALYSFDFDGTTGAVIDGNVITLHFVDGGRGDLDGKANGVIVDPGGPGGYGDYPVVVAAKVREVTFSGADFINIMADPGTPQYTGAHWVDADANGVLDLPEDHAWPIGYPRNTDSVVSAHFKATIQNFPYPPSNVTLKVRGSNANATHSPVYYVVPETTVTLTGDDLYLPPTTISNPFPDYVNHGQLTINWEFSSNGGGWTSAGQTSNELYVTLDTPDFYPVYHTLIHLSVPAAAVVLAQTPQQTIDAVWEVFKARNVSSKHYFPNLNNLPYTYYKEWDTTVGTLPALLNRTTNPTGDGQCGAIAGLFIAAVRDAGVRKSAVPAEGISVQPVLNETEIMLIKNWEFSGNGTSGVADYPYQNTLADPTKTPFAETTPGGLNSIFRKNATTNVWEYYWGALAEVTDMEGVPGQNTTNPKSTFSDHWLIKLGGKFYDPSYGLGPYVDRKAWEDASVSGFLKVEMVGNNYRLVLRKNLDPEDIKVKATLPNQCLLILQERSHEPIEEPASLCRFRR
jgi:hypothetical protein